MTAVIMMARGQEYEFLSAVCHMILFIMSEQSTNTFIFCPCYSVRLKQYPPISLER